MDRPFILSSIDKTTLVYFLLFFAEVFLGFFTGAFFAAAETFFTALFFAGAFFAGAFFAAALPGVAFFAVVGFTAGAAILELFARVSAIF